MPCLKPAFPQPAVPAVFAANNSFVPVFAACLQSLLEHISSGNFYDLVLLHRDISPENQRILLSMIADCPCVSLRFFNTAPLVENYHLEASGHITTETYYRFLIQDILPDYDKVLYLDCDLIIHADVADLYRTDVENYLLAAVQDIEFLGQVGGGRVATQIYCHDSFHMQDFSHYFQAGVILFNEAKMRQLYSIDQWLTFAAQPHMYHDQDVLNLCCEGQVKYLDMAWNVLHDCAHCRISQIVPYAPAELQQAYREARQHPKIIHYAGHRKPWHDSGEDMAEHFWAAARKTPYYEGLRAAMKERLCAERIALEKSRRRYAHRAVRWLVSLFFPPGTIRRERLRRLLLHKNNSSSSS